MLVDFKVLASSSAGNCYAVKAAESSIMLECGITIANIRRGCNFKLCEFEGCLISHSH